MTRHIHADKMLQYAQDAAETDKPWERWKFQEIGGCGWSLFTHPVWSKEYSYERKLVSQWSKKTITLFGCEVPKPLTQKQALASGIGSLLYQYVVGHPVIKAPVTLRSDCFWFHTKEDADQFATSIYSHVHSEIEKALNPLE
jgi:hypothetical protein